MKLANAVQFAHDHHVIHRDLKPANVLVVADASELEVKITDFGLAKLLAEESSQQTKSYAFLGTPSYMAPEQARGRSREVAPAADIYSLGAILYELLTGQPPFRGETPVETLQLLLSTEPVSVHQFAPRIPRDLATICDKCLQIEWNRRYASAGELQEDLNRYLEGRPILARPVGIAERARRWCRRNPLLAGAFGSVAMLLAGIAVVSLWYSAQLRRELTKTLLVQESERAAIRTSQRRLWDAYMSEATARNASRQVGQRFAALETIDKAIALIDTIGRGADQERQLRNAVLSSVALTDMRTVRAMGEWPLGGYAGDMSIAADCYVVATEDGTLSGYRLSDGQRLWTTKCSKSRVAPILSRDGQFVATIGESGTTVWRIGRSEPKLAWEAAHAQYFSFAPDGEHAAYSNPTEGMRLVRVSDGATVRAIGNGSARSQFAFDARTARIAVCGADNVQVIASDTGKVEVERPLGDVADPRVAWHPNGEYLAIWGSVGEITLWNVAAHATALSFAHSGVPAQLSFNDDGSILTSLSLWDRRLLVWDVGTGQRILEVPEFVSDSCDRGPNGQILFLTNRGGRRIVTELNAGARRTLPQALHVPLGFWHKVSVSPEGRIVACSSYHGLELWDLQTKRRLVAREIGPCVATFDNIGRLYVGCETGIYRLPRHVETVASSVADLDAARKLPDHRTVVRLGPPEQLVGPIVSVSPSVNTSGETIVFQDNHGWAVIRLSDNSAIIRLQTKEDARTSAVSNDNHYAAIANWYTGGVTAWDGLSGAHLADLAVGRYGVVQFSPDGCLLATTPNGVTLWRTKDWQRIGQLHAQGTTPDGLGIAFSPDSRVLAVGQVNGVLGLFDPLTGKEWIRLSTGDSSAASTLAFSPDQRWLIVSMKDEHSLAQVWDLVAMRRELAIHELDLPADVLHTTESPQSYEEHLEIVLDGGDFFNKPPQR